MASFGKEVLSGSTDGRPIKVVATATAGTTIHTGSSTAADIDEIFIWASNFSAAQVVLTFEWGGTTSPDDLLEFVIPPDETRLVIPGLIIKGNATPLVVKAFAGSANVIILAGFVNAIT